MFLFLSIISSSDFFYIKLPSNSKYMSEGSTPGLVDSLDNAMKCKIENSPIPGEPYIVNSKDNKIFDIENDKSELILYGKRHGGRNQRFIIILGSNNKSYIKNSNGQCIEYSTTKNHFIRTNCNFNTSQSFEIITENEVLRKDRMKNLYEQIDELNKEIDVIISAKNNLNDLNKSFGLGSRLDHPRHSTRTTINQRKFFI